MYLLHSHIYATPVFVKMFDVPKCRPWDIKKGRRFICCHMLIEEGHHYSCIEALKGKVFSIPRFYEITGEELVK